ncbi:conserved hypothetical protein [Ricinus communis]|uniref:Uncharacterized protein n=1 Tax=Ricinus communis TaxID=3988 RepID=B9S6M8_RICCO|nr:conserved hypothetical protein [Ricinus communis]
MQKAEMERKNEQHQEALKMIDELTMKNVEMENKLEQPYDKRMQLIKDKKC